MLSINFRKAKLFKVLKRSHDSSETQLMTSSSFLNDDSMDLVFSYIMWLKWSFILSGENIFLKQNKLHVKRHLVNRLTQHGQV